MKEESKPAANSLLATCFLDLLFYLEFGGSEFF
jgi:hypothetical protein